MSAEILDLEPAKPEWLTTVQVAAYLGYRGKHARESAHRWIARKQIRKHYRSQRCVLVRRADVDAELTRGA